LASFGSSHGKIYSLISNKDRLYSASSNGTVNIWNSKTLEHIITLNGHTAGVNSIKLFGDYLYSASSDKSIKVNKIKLALLYFC
jgi:WD40 repeat protein